MCFVLIVVIKAQHDYAHSEAMPRSLIQLNFHKSCILWQKGTVFYSVHTVNATSLTGPLMSDKLSLRNTTFRILLRFRVSL